MILHAICVGRAININDPATPYLYAWMPPFLKREVLLSALTKSSSPEAANSRVLSVIASVNRALDDLTHPDEQRQREQHLIINEAAAYLVDMEANRINPCNEKIDEKMEAQNVLSGAIIIGSLPLVTSLLTRTSSLALASINTESPYFGRPLQLAAAWGHPEIVRYLLDHGADPQVSADAKRAVDDDYQEPSRDLAIWEPFVYRSPAGSALRAAVLGGHEEIVRLLLKPEYRLSPSKTEYFRAIVAGARGGHIHIIQLLLQFTDKTISELKEIREEMLWEATRHNQEAVVQMLLDSGTNIDAAPYPPRRYGCGLSIAASQGYTRMVRLLLDRGADVNIEVPLHGYPIDAAARCGHDEVVTLLLERGASPEQAFLRAADSGQWRLVKRFLEDPQFHTRAGFSGDTIGMEALERAIIVKNPTVISILVEAGVPLNHKRQNPDDLPIIVAKMHAAEWIVALLLSLGAQDREFDIEYRGSHYSESHYSEQQQRGGVRITQRTWEWVGRY
jgi:ankyrin repeat protein